MTHRIHMFDDDEIFGNARVNAKGEALAETPEPDMVWCPQCRRYIPLSEDGNVTGTLRAHKAAEHR